MHFSRPIGIWSTKRISSDPMRVLADWDEEGEPRILHDFLDDISLTAEEMRLYIAMPQFSIADVKNLIADVNHLRAARKIAISSSTSNNWRRPSTMSQHRGGGIL